MVKPKASLDTVLKAVVSLQEQVSELPTKTQVAKMIDDAFESNEQLKKIDEIAKDVKALSKAVDKDAVAIVNHEKRIIKLEQHLVVK